LKVIVLGNGASGKSTFSRELGGLTGIACTELDAVFWSEDLAPMTTEDWRQLQEDLTADECWILDGDLGAYDALDVRLRRADAVVLFDVPTRVCMWRAVRRPRERRDFWWWLLTWRWRQMPHLLRSIHLVAPGAELIVIRNGEDRSRAMKELVQRAKGA
jgi:uridine kinase